MNRVLNFLIIILLLVTLPCSSTNHLSRYKKDLSPYNFGLAAANTGEERFEVLLKTHNAAVAAGVNVDYTGIDTVRLEIPAKTSSIPLTQYNDFKGCVFVVTNFSEDCYLYERRIEGTPIHVEKKYIDAGYFRMVDSLRNGRFLMIVEDENLWVQNRKGFSYGHSRKDILLVENGVAINSVIMPYNNAYSKPKCFFVRQGKEPLVIKNITIERAPNCTFLTHIAKISGINDVRFSNVRIHTPHSTLIDDRGINIYNCTNVTMNNVQIDGTYSQLNHSGYGICLDNVWNFHARHLYGKANWGIFGNNNVNTARIEESQINRFDIHCYGREISFKDVAFLDLYNQYSSVYGTIRYDRCTFTNFIPVQNAGSYNSFVEHDVVMNDCVFNATPNKSYVLNIRQLNEGENARYELAKKCLPNVYIKNLVVNMTGGSDRFYLFYCMPFNDCISDIGYLSNISINGLSINPEGEKPIKEMLLSNINIITSQPVNCKLTNVQVNQPATMIKNKSGENNVLLKTNITINGGKVVMKNVRNLRQQ